MKMRKTLAVLLLVMVLLSGALLIAGCSGGRSESAKGTSKNSRKGRIKESGRTSVKDSGKDSGRNREEGAVRDSAAESEGNAVKSRKNQSAGAATEETPGRTAADAGKKQKVTLDPDWEYASYSKIHTGQAGLYLTGSSNPKGITVCVNAGHGTKNGSAEKTLCHPDGSPKLVSGSSDKGSTMSAAISEGMTFSDGTPEADATLSLALILKDKLLAAGYDVLMIRETRDVQLDNIARTVIANHYAGCHIALHYDGTDSDKGAFYTSVPDVRSYREMEPVKSMWREHHKLGNALIGGLKKEGIPIFSDGTMAMDLTQTSYSTIPSADLEAGDAGSDISEEKQSQIADGIVRGINTYFSK